MVNHSNLIVKTTQNHQHKSLYRMGIFQNNEKSPCKINIYVGPLLFTWPRSGPPTF